MKPYRCPKCGKILGHDQAHKHAMHECAKRGKA